MPNRFRKSMISRTHTRRNTLNKRATMLTKSKKDLKLYEKQLKTLNDEIVLLDPVADFEIYRVKTKLIYVIMMELALDGVAASMALANKYSDKTGIKIDIKAFRKKSRKNLPSVKKIVKQAQQQGKTPDPGAIAAGYKW